MNCKDLRRLLQSYSDGELDLVRHLEIEEHLHGCPECAEQEEHLKSLRSALSSSSQYYHAPASLRTRIQLATPLVVKSPRRPMMRLAAMAAGVLFLIGSSAILGALLSRAAISTDDRLAEAVVANHVRSLQVNHLTDVASTDRHTVKPWFRGKLNFSPQVPDLSSQGYTLSGGRLDYLADRPVAALAYHRRLHTINLFTWPAANNEEKVVRMFSRQGYHLRYWERSGMTYWAISDLNEKELDQFVREIQEHSVE
jgi:anti-sigma factor RsiW